LRAQAELENYRKRADRQIEEERRYANLPLVRDLLPALDDLHRAIEAAEKSANGTGLLDGVRIVAEKLEAALKKHHCVRIEALGGPFDPHCHDAIAQQPSAEHPAQTVMAVAQHGFMLHDRVVRPSQVIVSGGPAAEPPAAAGG
jgi:molecular chaperone GrpE